MDHSVWCWGSNDHGQIGPGSARALPQLVFDAGSADDISAASNHTCVQSADALSCFGDNAYGQVLVPPTYAKSLTPIFPSGVRHVSTGYFHNCVLLLDAGVSCWGDNPDLECSPDGGSPVGPTLHPWAGAVDQVGANQNSTCVVKNASVSCFGYGADGFGNPTTPGDLVVVAGTDDVRALAPGDNMAIAVLGDGGVVVWNKVTLDGLEYVRATAGMGGPVSAVTVGAQSACAVMTNGAVKCWGDNSVGELGRSGTGGGYQPQFWG
jgi:alpha-tubulin suppressor-like RCC1 family protein